MQLTIVTFDLIIALSLIKLAILYSSWTPRGSYFWLRESCYSYVKTCSLENLELSMRKNLTKSFVIKKVLASIPLLARNWQPEKMTPPFEALVNLIRPSKNMRLEKCLILITGSIIALKGTISYIHYVVWFIKRLFVKDRALTLAKCPIINKFWIDNGDKSSLKVVTEGCNLLLI